jgi:hypothetical protein
MSVLVDIQWEWLRVDLMIGQRYICRLQQLVMYEQVASAMQKERISTGPFRLQVSRVTKIQQVLTFVGQFNNFYSVVDSFDRGD